MAIDGTERRRHRPQDATAQQAPSSGKKKAPTDKNILLVHEMTSTGVYRGPTEPGKTPDKKATDQPSIASPLNATLAKDTGFQGYEPERVLTMPPPKSHEARP